MYTTVDFRRKLLRFDRPLYPQYKKSPIPKFYSSFFGSWRPNYTNIECKNTLPQRLEKKLPQLYFDYIILPNITDSVFLPILT